MVILLAASLLGLCLAGYFTLLARGTVSPSARVLPRWCRMDESSCRRVLSHPDARLAGVPNALVGMAYYVTVLSYATGVLPAGIRPWFVAAAWLSVAAGAYLTWSLVARLRVVCRLCLLAHGVNLGIAILITWG